MPASVYSNRVVTSSFDFPRPPKQEAAVPVCNSRRLPPFVVAKQQRVAAHFATLQEEDTGASRRRRNSTSSMSSTSSASSYGQDDNSNDASESLSEPSTAASSRSNSAAGDELLQCLGLSAVEGIMSKVELDDDDAAFEDALDPHEQIAVEAKRAPEVTTYNAVDSPRQVPRTAAVADNKSLHSSASCATIRQSQHLKKAVASEHSRALSFPRTELAELDIESILDAYADWDLAAGLAAAGAPELPTPASHPRPVSRPPSFPMPAPPPAPTALASPLPYSDLFPTHRVSPFPTVPKRRKSSTSLASSSIHERETRDAVPPLPALPLFFGTSPRSPPSSAFSAFPTAPAFRRPSECSSLAPSSWSGRPGPRSNRDSVTSSIASGYSSGSGHSSSFRWSTYSGSTAPSTIAESDEDHREALSPARKVAGPVPGRTPRHQKRQSEMMDWTTFAHELLEEEEREEEELVAVSSPPTFASAQHKRENAPDSTGSGYIHFDREVQRKKSMSGSSIKSARSARSAKSTRTFVTSSPHSTNVYLAQDDENESTPSLPRRPSSSRSVRSVQTLPPPVPSLPSSILKTPQSQAMARAGSAPVSASTAGSSTLKPPTTSRFTSSLRHLRSSPNLKSGVAVAAKEKEKERERDESYRGLARFIAMA